MGRFLLLSECGDGLGLAIRLQSEGHETKLWVRDKKELGLGRGLVAEAQRYEKTVLSDCTGFGLFMDALRESEFRTFAGSEFADKLEEERGFSQAIMEHVGIKTPRSKLVSSPEEAEEFIKLYDRVAIKPLGGLSGVYPSEVAQDQDDAMDILESMEGALNGTGKLELQEFIPGIAVSTEGWFNGHDWITGMFNHTLERKQRQAGDLGDSIGCLGNLVWSCKEDPLVRATLLKLTDVLREHLYVGPIDINCIVNEEGCYGLEFTPRFGYDAFPTLLYSLCHFDFGEFILACCRGEGNDYELTEGFGAGVRIYVPEGKDAKVKIRGLDLEDLDRFYPYCVEFDEWEISSTGESGQLGVINGHGDSPDSAFADAYLVVEKVKAKKLSYRNDLLETFTDEYNQLENVLDGESLDYIRPWVAFDLDGTLAEYSKWSEEIGKPYPSMIQKVKDHLKKGDFVKILTARGSINPGMYEQLLKIHAFIKENVGQDLQVTNSKDPGMIELYDDRVVLVKDGEVLTEEVGAQ